MSFHLMDFKQLTTQISNADSSLIEALRMKLVRIWKSMQSASFKKHLEFNFEQFKVNSSEVWRGVDFCFLWRMKINVTRL